MTTTKTAGNFTKGSRYDETKDLDIAEIAKLVRKDIKDAQADARLPSKGVKFSVRVARYSMGESITIDLTFDRPIRVTADVEATNRDPKAFKPHPWLTRRAHEAHFECELILDRYNFRKVRENCDSDDYRFGSDVNVYGAEGFAPAEEIEQERREHATLLELSGNVIPIPAPIAVQALAPAAPAKSDQVELLESLGVL